MNFTEETATDAVIASLADTKDPRIKQVMEAVVRHLHAIVREVEPSINEWNSAINFLTAVGQASSDTRQEFILLSDVLGVSMLVETINARRVTVGQPTNRFTPSTVIGPFHMVSSKPRILGENIDVTDDGEPCVVTGTVVDSDGNVIPGASVDVWQSTGGGFYDVQQPKEQPQGNCRGLFTTDVEGQFWFRTVIPSFYPIPTDGPVGELLRVTGRHPYRPAHIHFIVSSPGIVPLTTHVFVADSPYIDSDAVFAVNFELVKDFQLIDDEDQAATFGVSSPFRFVDIEFVVRHQSVSN